MPQNEGLFQFTIFTEEAAWTQGVLEPEEAEDKLAAPPCMWKALRRVCVLSPLLATQPRSQALARTAMPGLAGLGACAGQAPANLVPRGFLHSLRPSAGLGGERPAHAYAWH